MSLQPWLEAVQLRIYQHTFPKQEYHLEAMKVNYSFITIFWNSVYDVSQTFSPLKPNPRSTELSAETGIHFARLWIRVQATSILSCFNEYLSIASWKVPIGPCHSSMYVMEYLNIQWEKCNYLQCINPTTASSTCPKSICPSLISQS